MIFHPVSSTLNYFHWNTFETYIDSNLDVEISLQTKLVNIKLIALKALTNSIVETRGIAISKCEIKFESVIIDDHPELLIREREWKAVSTHSGYC